MMAKPSKGLVNSGRKSGDRDQPGGVALIMNRVGAILRNATYSLLIALAILVSALFVIAMVPVLAVLKAFGLRSAVESFRSLVGGSKNASGLRLFAREVGSELLNQAEMLSRPLAEQIGFSLKIAFGIVIIALLALGGYLIFGFFASLSVTTLLVIIIIILLLK